MDEKPNVEESMLERVAKAICFAQTQSDDVWEAFRSEARAAIEAMRQPTLPMVRAGFHAIDDFEADYDLRVVVDMRANACWAKMIDAILSHPGG